MIGSVILIIVFTFLNAVFASAEIAVISMNEAKLRHLVDDGNKRAKKLSLLTEQPARFLATIQVAITLSGFLNSAFASDNFAGVIVDALISVGVPVPRATLNSIAVIIITIVLSYISIVFGELVPKRIAMKKLRGSFPWTCPYPLWSLKVFFASGVSADRIYQPDPEAYGHQSCRR